MKMVLEEKRDYVLSKGEVGTSWVTEDIKSFDDCMKLIVAVLELGAVDRIECRGYSDMDTHGNECFFRSKEEFKNGVETIKKVDADNISVYIKIGGSDIGVGFHGIGYEGGLNICVAGNEKVVDNVVSFLKKYK